MKYGALKSFLSAKQQGRVRMSFAEVAQAAGIALPASAFRHPSWWANDPEHHAQARAWIDAGYKAANVDIQAQSVEFVRTVAPARGVREMRNTYNPKPDPPYKVHPAYGALKGTFTIRDWDVTKPAMDADELAAWDARLEEKAKLIDEGLRRKK